MVKFLILISFTFLFCSISFGQERILINEKYKDIIDYVTEEFIEYKERTYNNNITLSVEALDSIGAEHIYIISFKTGKCISQTHIYNERIKLVTNIHFIKNDTIVEIVKEEDNKYYRIYYELK